MASTIRFCTIGKCNLAKFPKVQLKPVFVSSKLSDNIEYCKFPPVFKRNTSNFSAFLSNIHVTSQSNPISLNLTSKRYYKKFLTWPTPKLPFNYVRKDKLEALFNSGDPVADIGTVDPTKPKLHFEMSEELQTADENVKRLFSLGMATQKEISDFKRTEMIRSVQQHKFDLFSDEVKIAKLSYAIRSLQKHMRLHPSDRTRKVILNEAILKRNKRLKILHRTHLERFEWLVDVLKINYKPPLLGINVVPVTRKGELRRLTQEFCDNIRNTRLNAYHETLKAQQADFIKEKEEMLKMIAEEEKILGISDGKADLKN